MTAEEYYIKKFNAVKSTKYPDRYDVDGDVHLSFKNLTELPIPFGVTEYFDCSYNHLATLYNAPIEVRGDFWCYANKLINLDNLPKYIRGDFVCWDNPFENLNGLKGVRIKGLIYFYHMNEYHIQTWFKALRNTDLDALEWHYDNHKYKIYNEDKYIINFLDELIKVKRIKRDLKVN